MELETSVKDDVNSVRELETSEVDEVNSIELLMETEPDEVDETAVELLLAIEELLV